MLQPEDDSWVAIGYDDAHDRAGRLGTAVVIESSRLLTCAHVIADGRARNGYGLRSQRPRVLCSAAGGRPRSAKPPTIWTLPCCSWPMACHVALQYHRCGVPHRTRYERERWWAFGFAGSRRGNSAYGLVGESLGDGCIRIDADPSTTYRLQEGFSGGGYGHRISGQSWE